MTLPRTVVGTLASPEPVTANGLARPPSDNARGWPGMAFEPSIAQCEFAVRARARPAVILLDDLGGLREHVSRYFKTDFLGGLAVDDEFKFGWELDGEFCRAGALDDLIDVIGGATVLLREVHPI